MAVPFASSQDVADRWRPLTSVEQSAADTLVADASALIRARFPGIDAQVTSGGIDGQVLTAITANMVKRALIAPADGITQQSEAMGPYSRSQTFANPLGNVFLTAAETTLILGYQPAGQSMAFSNDTDRTGPDWYSRVYGG